MTDILQRKHAKSGSSFLYVCQKISNVQECGRQCPPPPAKKKKIHAVIPGNWEYIILHGKKDFTDVSGYDSETG